MGKFFNPNTALSYAYVVMRDGSTVNRASVQKWDNYSLLFGAMKLKRHITKAFSENDVKLVVIYNNQTRKEIDRMVPFTASWNDNYPPRT
jgi:hypothetical protein